MSVDISTLALRVESLEVEAAEGRLKKLSAAAGNTEKSTSSLSKATSFLGRAFAGLALAEMARQTIMLADSYTRAEGRLKLVTSSSAELTSVQKGLYEASQRSNTSYIASVEVFSRFAQATKGTSTSTGQLVAMTETLNKAFTISGASGQEAQSAMVQLSQAFSSGVLRGEEFNSIAEQGGRIMDMLADYTGKSRGELRKMAEGGLLTADVLKNAIATGAAKVNAEFSLLPVTVAAASTQLANALGALVSDANKASGATRGIADAISDVAVAIDTNKDKISTFFAEMRGGAAAISSGMEMLAEAGAGGEMKSISQADQLRKTIKGLNEEIAFAASTPGLAAINSENGDMQKMTAELSRQEGLLKGIVSSPYITGEAGKGFGVITTMGRKAADATNGVVFAMEGVKRQSESSMKQTDEMIKKHRSYIETKEQAAEREYREALQGAQTDKDRTLAAVQYEKEKAKLREEAANKVETAASKEEAAANKREAATRELERVEYRATQVIIGRLNAEADLLEVQGQASEAMKKRIQADVLGIRQNDEITKGLIEQKQALELLNLEVQKRNSLKDAQGNNRLIEAENAANAPGQSALGEVETRLQAEIEGINSRYDQEERRIQENMRQIKLAKDWEINGIQEVAEAQRELNNLQTKASHDTVAVEKKAAESKMAIYSEYAGMASSALNMMADSQDQNSKEGFESAKDFASAAAAVNTAVAIMAQLTIPGPIGWAGAAMAAVAGIQQIANIQSTEYGSKGTVSSPGGSGASAASLPKSTVLGAADGTGSESVGNSYQLMEDTYELTDVKLTAIYHILKDLNANITGLVTNLVRTGGLSTDGMNLKLGDEMGAAESFARSISVIIDPLDKLLGGFIGNFAAGLINGIFGGSKKSVVEASGIAIGDTLIANLEKGVSVSASQYAKVKTVTDGGWFGSDKTSYSTAYAALDGSVTSMLTLVFGNMSDIMIELAGQFGTDVNKVMAYTFKGAMLDLKGLDSEAMQKKISEYFSGIADNAVDTLFGSIIGQYQKLGEGMMETATRVIVDRDAVVAALDLTNQSFAGTVLQVIDFSERLIEMAGGVDAFVEATTTYYDKFFSDEEKQTRTGEQLTAVMAAMGKSLPAARDGYRAIVEGLDLTTVSGMEAYVTLLKLADTADTYYSSIEKATEAAKSFFDGIENQFMSMLDKLNPEKGSADYLGQIGAVLAQAQNGDFSGIKGLDTIATNFSNTGDGAYASKADYQRAVWGAYHLVEEIEKLNDGRQSFDVGTPFVPYNMTADIHQGEIIMDTASSNVLRKYGIPTTGSTKELEAKLDAVIAELSALRAEQRMASMQIAVNTKKTADLSEKSDVIGTPPVRSEA